MYNYENFIPNGSPFIKLGNKKYYYFDIVTGEEVSVYDYNTISGVEVFSYEEYGPKVVSLDLSASDITNVKEKVLKKND